MKVAMNQKSESRTSGDTQLGDNISRVLANFTAWLDSYGETSWDYQSFFAGPVGGRAKALYYSHGLIGTAAVAPMIFWEAFLQVFELTGQDEWKVIVESIARHAAADIKDFRTSERASSSSYTPFDKGGVANAAAYRAFLLTSASKFLANEEYWKIAERNLNFVLESQNPDGSWFYAMDGVRDFVDHYHTCFVMKAIAKIYGLTGHEPCKEALSKGIKYYLENLFDDEGLPNPFSKAPRLTVDKRELYDWAECINLCLLLRA